VSCAQQTYCWVQHTPLPSFPNGIELDEGADRERSWSIGYQEGIAGAVCVCVGGGGLSL